MRHGLSSFLVGARLGPRAAFALISAGITLGVVSCGSRTGLFGPGVDDGVLGPTVDAGPDADLDGAVPCVPGRFNFELALTQLMFVIDRSGSMDFTLDGQLGGRPSRWTLLRDALEQTLPTFDQQIAMGAKFYPELPRSNGSEESCRTDPGVALAPARGNARAIVDNFARPLPRGGTPTSEAVRVAAQYLTRSRGVARTIVLATDGAPNCNGALDARSCICTSASAGIQCDQATNGRFSCLDDGRTIETIRSIATDQKIPVFVIGIGSTEKPAFLRVLDEMAIAGGRPRATAPRHYNVQSPSDLTNALTTIRDSVAKCTYLTPSAPKNPDLITVEINGVVIPRDPAKINGWDWIDQAFGWLGFFGDACEAAQGNTPKASTVSGVVNCDE
jgi:hypothetical protein